MEITYNQVLADEMIESAKTILVEPRRYEYDELEDQDDGLDVNKLENPEEFNKFHGDRNKPENIISKKVMSQTANYYTTDVSFLKDTQQLLKEYKPLSKKYSRSYNKLLDFLKLDKMYLAFD